MRSAAGLVLGAALYALALPPFDWAVCGWLALVPLLLAVRPRRALWAAGYGALYGVACAWAVGGWWLAHAIAGYFRLGVPVAVLVTSIYVLVFWGLPFGIFGAGTAVLLGRQRAGGARVTVAALWVATELLRGRFLGQPWNLLGYTQHAHTALVQVAVLTGVYGVSFLLAFGSVGIADALVLARAGRTRQAIASLALPFVVVGWIWAVGALVAERGPTGGFHAEPIAIVQTNVQPAYQWTRVYTERVLLAHMQATDRLPATERPALVVWPENAVPRFLETDPMLAADLGALAVRHGADLLFGAPRYDGERTYNSVRLITAAGRNGGTYDKQRLVLLAETNPLRPPAPAAPNENPTRFSAGEEPGVLRSFVPLGVTICHETIFPELVARTVAAGAQVLVNVANDGWLDGGSGVASRQTFAMAVFRAVETRRYLVRAATTGVSGVIDPYGTVVEALPPHVAGVITTSVAGRSTLTPYVRAGDVFAFACLLGAAAALFGRRAPVVRRYPRLIPSGPASS